MNIRSRNLNTSNHSEDQTLCTFLSSSLNVELVYVILTGVTEFVRERQFWINNSISSESKF